MWNAEGPSSEDIFSVKLDPNFQKELVEDEEDSSPFLAIPSPIASPVTLSPQLRNSLSPSASASPSGGLLALPAGEPSPALPAPSGATSAAAPHLLQAHTPAPSSADSTRIAINALQLTPSPPASPSAHTPQSVLPPATPHLPLPPPAGAASPHGDRGNPTPASAGRAPGQQPGPSAQALELQAVSSPSQRAVEFVQDASSEAIFPIPYPDSFGDLLEYGNQRLAIPLYQRSPEEAPLPLQAPMRPGAPMRDQQAPRQHALTAPLPPNHIYAHGSVTMIGALDEPSAGAPMRSQSAGAGAGASQQLALRAEEAPLEWLHGLPQHGRAEEAPLEWLHGLPQHVVHHMVHHATPPGRSPLAGPEGWDVDAAAAGPHEQQLMRQRHLLDLSARQLSRQQRACQHEEEDLKLQMRALSPPQDRAPAPPRPALTPPPAPDAKGQLLQEEEPSSPQSLQRQLQAIMRVQVGAQPSAPRDGAGAGAGAGDGDGGGDGPWQAAVEGDTPTVWTAEEVAALKQRFCRLLLGEDTSGGRRGVSPALSLSNSITNLGAACFGCIQRLEPLAPPHKAKWHRELAWLLAPCEQIIERVVRSKEGAGGEGEGAVEVLVPEQRADLREQLPILVQHATTLVQVLDTFLDKGFHYEEQAPGGGAQAEGAGAKWWLPRPVVPAGGLGSSEVGHLRTQRTLCQRILTAVRELNTHTIQTMDIPPHYVRTLESTAKATLGDTLYKALTSDGFKPDKLAEAEGLEWENPQRKQQSLRHKLDAAAPTDKGSSGGEDDTGASRAQARARALQLANRVEAALHVWWGKGLKQWAALQEEAEKGGEGSEKAQRRAERLRAWRHRAASFLSTIRTRWPSLGQTALTVGKIEGNRDVGLAVLEALTRVEEALAAALVARLDAVLQAHQAAAAASGRGAGGAGKGAEGAEGAPRQPAAAGPAPPAPEAVKQSLAGLFRRRGRPQADHRSPASDAAASPEPTPAERSLEDSAKQAEGGQPGRTAAGRTGRRMSLVQLAEEGREEAAARAAQRAAQAAMANKLGAVLGNMADLAHSPPPAPAPAPSLVTAHPTSSPAPAGGGPSPPAPPGARAVAGPVHAGHSEAADAAPGPWPEEPGPRCSPHRAPHEPGATLEAQLARTGGDSPSAVASAGRAGGAHAHAAAPASPPAPAPAADWTDSDDEDVARARKGSGAGSPSGRTLRTLSPVLGVRAGGEGAGGVLPSHRTPPPQSNEGMPPLIDLK